MKRLPIVASMLLVSVQVLGAQTCKPNSISASTPGAEFNDNGDGTVTDIKTGLMWKKCSEGLSGNSCAVGTANTYTWKQALQLVATINSGSGFAGYKDWRLPNIAELSSIIEDQCVVPAVNLTIFPNTAAGGYWSSTPVADDPNQAASAWVGDFMNGLRGVQPKTNSYEVRLVRGQ